jgi:segregation and condensation protein B
VNAAPSLTQIIEALLFASPEPLTAAAMVRAIRTAATQAKREAAGAEDDQDDERDPSEATGATPPDVEPVHAEIEFALEMDEVADGATHPHPIDPFRKITEAEVASALAELATAYQAEGRAFTLEDRVSGWRILTRPEYGVWVRGLFPDRKAQRLSQPALETLAIIAYRQPITKAAIEAVRGVTIDGPLQRLLDQNLVRISGRADLPGRPLLYETTDLFFEHFGIKSIDDLPNASELRRVALPQAESEKPAETQTGADLPQASQEDQEPRAADEAGRI